MAYFLEDLYHRLSSLLPRSPSRSTSPSPSLPPSRLSALAVPIITMSPSSPNNNTNDSFSSLMAESESAISDMAQSRESGYFPTSPRSSVSSTLSAESALLPSHPMHVPQPTELAPVKLDALSRHFPKPTHEADVAELLERKPGKYSLAHYVKNARDVKPHVVDKVQQSKAFEDIKKELLLAQQQLASRQR